MAIPAGISQAESDAPARAARWPALVAGLGVAVLIAEAAAFCAYGTTVFDEGGYTYQGWLTVAHGWVPYRDFYLKTTPLVYIIHGVTQYLFGPSLLVGRVTSCVFALAAVGLGMVMARRLGGDWAAALVPWLLATSFSAQSYHFHAYAVGVTVFLSMTALCALTWSRRPVAGAYLGGAATALLLLCRHDMFFVGVVAWLYLLVWHPAPRAHRWRAFAISVGMLLAVMLPLYLASPENVLYSLSFGRFAPPDIRPGYYHLDVPVSLRSIAWHVMIWLRFHAGAMVLFIPSAVLLVRGAGISRGAGLQTRQDGGKGRGSGEPRYAVILLPLAFGLVDLLVRLIAAILVGQKLFAILYTYDFLPLAVAAAVTYSLACEGLSGPSQRLYHAALGVLAILFMPVLTGSGPMCRLSFARPTDLQRVAIGARLVAEHTTPRDRIFTAGDPHFLLEARRFVLPAMTEQFFGFRDARDTARLERLHLFNQETIHRWLRSEATVAVISDGALEWLRDSGRYAGGEALARLIERDVAGNYELVGTAEGAYQGTVRVYRRR